MWVGCVLGRRFAGQAEGQVFVLVFRRQRRWVVRRRVREGESFPCYAKLGARF